MKTAKFIFCILAAGFLLGCRGNTEAAPPPVPSTLSILDDPHAQEKIFLAFAEAYPNKITFPEYLDDDWTMLVNGKLFYFANGRFLPEELRDKWEDYIPYDFYPYPWQGTEAERQAAFKDPVYSIGSSFLFDALFNSPSEDDSWDLQVKYSFLGVKMLVHSDIKPILDMVALQIRGAALSEPAIGEWMAELATTPPTYGWNWRSIAGTRRRSNHSYGTAIDLLPRDLKGRSTYWLWDKGKKKNKKDAVYYLPPETVIKIFEDYGFIWGGKWDLTDTMHFEYRPEMLLLNGYPVIR
jgi:hypothetical protein